MKLTQKQYEMFINKSIDYKQSKFKNKKIIIDGIKFDSKKEGYYYIYLKELEKTNKISNLQLQVKYELQPKFKYNNKTYRAITYIADFVYEENGKTSVIDVKGFKTDVYNLKKKLLLYNYPNIIFKEI